MPRMRSGAAVLLVVALGLAGCAGPAGTGESVTVTEDFEKGIRQWRKGADVPQDPNREGQNVSWSISSSRDEAHGGDYSVNFTLDGSQDDGTIWLVRPLQVTSGQTYRANVSAWAWSASESFNTLAHLVLYLGPERPVLEEDFPPPGENTTGDPDAERGGLREDLNKQEGWREYRFAWQVPPDNNGTLWAAVGISAVWETEMTYYVDDLRIHLDPATSQGDGSGSQNPY